MLVLAASIPLMTSGTLLQHGTGVLSQVSTWHPVLMTFGIGFMITLGISSYTVNFFSERFDTRPARRGIHAVCQVTGFLSCIAGWACMFTAHQKRDPGSVGVHFAAGRPAVDKFHVFMGYSVLILITLQSLVGMRKYFLLLPPTRKRSFALHGIVGPFIYLLAMIVVVLGAFSWWSGSNVTRWEATFRVILPCVAILLVLLAMYRVFAGPRMGSSVRHASHHPPLLLSPSPGAPITAYVNDDSDDMYEAF